jgi:transglutaminase-like putative cysteine protease
MRKLKWLFALMALMTACSLPTASPTPTKPPDPTLSATPTSTPKPTITPTPTPTTTPTPEIVYTSAFGIDYANPEKYLAPGTQTTISSPELLDPLRTGEHSIAHLRRVYFWMKKEFEGYAAGGATIGVVTVDQLFEERRLGGCNDHGLVYVSMLRELGYPAVFVNSVSIAWVELYQNDEDEQHIGHTFVEVFVDGKWVLIDSTNGFYVEEEYDPTNPVIPLEGAIAGSTEEIYGFYVSQKGIDQWDLGIHSMEDMFGVMDHTADQIVLNELEYPPYTFKNFKTD